eukprot:TRINITY_DN8449_c0_g1_i1.p1 TRINITY_DN8449_c0_g1~~TRINITY_DN8449_c0_g1_i1.p1  ORF type:complete len:401 (+),score=106.86 TRINITY_DN8449_c0_g1_i1:50-1204(+)
MYYTQDEYRRVTQYKGGVTTDNSIMYKFVVSPACAKIVSHMPSWFAPNVLTFIGLLCNIAAYILVSVHSPDLRTELPGWVSATCGLLIFSYMMLDNCDGKQAFRTGSSSPLGELFDHGCDSLTIGMGAITTAGILGAGPWHALAYVASGYIPFYLAHWEEYWNHSLVLGSWNGPTEAECAAISFYLVSAVFGTSIWQTPVTVPVLEVTVPANYLVLSFCLFATAFTAVNSLWSGTRLAASKGVNLGDAYAYFAPFVLAYSSAAAWLYLDLGAFERHYHLFLVGTSFLFGYLTINTIIQRMCGLSYTYFYVPVIPVFLAAVHGYLVSLYGAQVQLAKPQVVYSLIYSFYLANLLLYVKEVIAGFTRHLNIRVFHIKYPNKATKVL